MRNRKISTENTPHIPQSTSSGKKIKLTTKKTIDLSKNKSRMSPVTLKPHLIEK